MNIMKYMEIIVFSTYGYSLNTWNDSGTLKRELALYKKMNEDFGTKFTFVTYGDSRDLNFNIQIKDSKIIPVYSLIKYEKNRIKRYLYSFKIPFKIRHLIKNGDILHQHQLLGSWVPIICKVIMKKKLLVRTGYDMHEFAKHEKKGFFVKLLYKFLTKISLLVSDIYTVTSQSDKKNLKLNKKIKLRPNWVYETELYDFTNRHENRLLSVGRLEDQKNYEYFIKEFRNTKNKLIIDIYGSGKNIDKLKKTAEEHNVELNIYENLPHDDLTKIYQNYKFFITPSLYEGNPKTVLEAMSSGCIVLASNIENHSEIIENKHNGYLFNLGKNSLLNLFLEIKKYDKKLNTISKNAFNDIAKNNSLELLVSKTHKDYLSITK